MTQPWGGAPDQWNRGRSPWAPGFGGEPQWPAPPYGAQPYGRQTVAPAPRPPRRRRGFFGSLVRAAVMFCLLMFAFSAVRGVLSGTGGSPAPSGGTQSSTSSSGSTTTSATTPASGSTTGTSGGSQQSGGTGTTQYQNEGYQPPPADYNPPDLPQPSTFAQAQTWLTSNAIYAGSVPSPTDCRMMPITAGLTKSQLQSRLNDLVACLMQVWAPPVTAAGFELPRPPVTVYASSVTTACGVMKDVNAAYCSGDQHVYYALGLLDSLPPRVASTKYAVEDVIAHEFGHAIQARTGILISEMALEKNATKSEATVLSRRAEQQADCFGALYVASVARSQGLSNADLQNLVTMTYYLGDDVLSGEANIQGDHGLGTSRQAWFSKGVQTTRIGVCNTWTAPAAQVR